MSTYTPYQKRLFLFLSVATFFEGYDFMALSRVLPKLRADFGLSEGDAGTMLLFVNFGTVIAYLLVRQADKWGRRKVLTITIAGYTLATLGSALAPEVYSFTILQSIGRVFLIGEWAIAMVIAAEEFPAAKRGVVIGVLQAFSSLGSIVCAAVAPMLLDTEYGWRSVYLVGVAPLVLIMYARRGLKETTRFEEQRNKAGGAPAEQRPLTAIWSTGRGKRILQLAAIWFFTYMCTQTAIAFWTDYAISDLTLTEGKVSLVLTVGSIASLPLVFGAGKLIDVLGRKPGAIIIFIATSIGVFGAYFFTGDALLMACMALAIFGVSGVLPVLNAFTTELFPTEWRGDAFAWSNNLMGRVGYVLAPFIVGQAAVSMGYGAAIRVTAIAPLIALALILWWMPETNQLELEESAKLG
jgi:putative MFS transporter